MYFTHVHHKTTILSKVFYTLFIIALLATNSSGDFYDGFNGERPFTVRMTRFICNYNKSSKYVVIHECNLKLLRNASSLISFNATFLKPLEPVWMTLKLWFRTNGQVFKPMFGIDEREDLCQIFAKEGNGNAVLGVFYKIFKHYLPQIIRPCPFLGEYSLKNLQFNEKMYPPFVPAGDYRFDFEALHVSNETLFALQYYGSVRSKGLADLSLG